MNSEDLRLAVYTSFVATGGAPGLESLAGRLGVDQQQIRLGLRQLAEQRHLVLDSQDQVLMAHPFSAVPLGFVVMGATTLWWGGCAWDSFALPHLLPDESSVLVATRCPACHRAHAWDVGRHEPPAGEQLAHFLIPVAQMWDDVVRTCAQQRIFCSGSCIDRWLAETQKSAGSVLDLATLWRLAQGWYEGRLEYGYQRRDPANAARYLRHVGLMGPFWGI